MASQSAHFNLTKPATTDYYNLGVINANTDIIDQQMYNNQQSAAKIMVGASANEDGESGRVPAPSAGDEDKYLKANGTWDTPSGGGGGSATLSGLTDVDLSSPTNGQILKYNSTTQKWENANESGGGGGGNARFESTELLSSTISTGGTYTLEDALENYDFVTIVSGTSNESDVRTVAVEDILNTLSDGITVNLIGASDRWVNITACSGTSITIAMNAPYIHSIKGYKLVGGGGSSSHTYSTTEQKVGTWIDGSDIYEKSFEVTITQSSNPIIEQDASYIDALISYDAVVKNTSGYMSGVGMNARGWDFALHRNPLEQLLIFGDVSEAIGGKAYVTIRYTKVSTS